jgi:hypothetical protein
METEKQFNFQVKGIEILETSLNTPKTSIDDTTTFGFDLQVEQSFNVENKLGIITCAINIRNNETQEKYGHFKASCLYYIEDIESFIDKKNNTANFPESIIIMLNSISISTVRGVMYGAFRGTYLNGAILPVVNPSGLKQQDSYNPNVSQ